jgi:hypothetical protein
VAARQQLAGSEQISEKKGAAHKWRRKPCHWRRLQQRPRRRMILISRPPPNWRGRPSAARTPSTEHTCTRRYESRGHGIEFVLARSSDELDEPGRRRPKMSSSQQQQQQRRRRRHRQQPRAQTITPFKRGNSGSAWGRARRRRPLAGWRPPHHLYHLIYARLVVVALVFGGRQAPEGE